MVPNSSEPKLPSLKNLNVFIAACLFVIATILLAEALVYTKPVMVPFIFSLFLSYFVYPIVKIFSVRLRFPHWLAVIMAFVVFIAVLFSVGLIFSNSLIGVIDSFYQYQERLTGLTQAVVSFFARFNIHLGQALALEKVKEFPIFSYVQTAAGSAMTLLLDTSLVLIFLIFLVSGRESGGRQSGLGEEIDEKIRAYILTKIATSLLTSLLVWGTFMSFSLELATMFSLLCFFLCFIPTIGPIVATLLPLPVALIQYQTTAPIVCIVAIPAFIQILLGNLLEPKLLGKGLDLHPITILLSLMFWGLIWGISGMFLAVPITAVLKLVMERIPLTQRVSEVLAGRTRL